MKDANLIQFGGAMFYGNKNTIVYLMAHINPESQTYHILNQVQNEVTKVDSHAIRQPLHLTLYELHLNYHFLEMNNKVQTLQAELDRFAMNPEHPLNMYMTELLNSIEIVPFEQFDGSGEKFIILGEDKKFLAKKYWPYMANDLDPYGPFGPIETFQRSVLEYFLSLLVPSDTMIYDPVPEQTPIALPVGSIVPFIEETQTGASAPILPHHNMKYRQVTKNRVQHGQRNDLTIDILAVPWYFTTPYSWTPHLSLVKLSNTEIRLDVFQSIDTSLLPSVTDMGQIASYEVTLNNRQPVWRIHSQVQFT